MNLIFEGSDNVGKSTLIKSIVNYIQNNEPNSKIHLYHYCAYPEYRNETVYNIFLDELNMCSKYDYNIFDRSFFSEIIYANIKQRECKFSKNDFCEFFEIIQKLNFKIIYLYRNDYKNHLNTIINETNSYIKSDELKKLIATYENFYSIIENTNIINHTKLISTDSNAINEILKKPKNTYITNTSKIDKFYEKLIEITNKQNLRS